VLQLRAGGLVIAVNPLSQAGAIGSAHFRSCPRPACITIREFVAAGGLMSYGAVFDEEVSRLVGLYAPHSQGREPLTFLCSNPPRFDCLTENSKGSRPETMPQLSRLARPR